MTQQSQNAPSQALAAADQAQQGVDRLIHLLSQQHSLYLELTDLSRRQEDYVKESRTEQLLSLLSDRQVLVDQLTGINRELAPLRSRMSELAADADDAKRETLRGLVDDVQEMLQSIIERDESDRKKLEASKAAVGNALKTTTTAPRALGAYRSAGPQPAAAATARPQTARFTDQRG
jgi:uncharacterized protein YoxC